MKARKAFFELGEVFSGEEVRWAPASHDPSPQFERQGASLGVSAPNTGGAKWIGRRIPSALPLARGGSWNGIRLHQAADAISEREGREVISHGQG